MAEARLDHLIRRNSELEDEVAALKSILKPEPLDEYRALGLSKREAVILRVLAAAAPEVVSFDRIIIAAELDRGSAHNMRTMIGAYCASIRKKLAGTDIKILSEHGVGYRLSGKDALDALVKGRK